jgi:hypothetical protein
VTVITTGRSGFRKPCIPRAKTPHSQTVQDVEPGIQEEQSAGLGVEKTFAGQYAEELGRTAILTPLNRALLEPSSFFCCAQSSQFDQVSGPSRRLVATWSVCTFRGRGRKLAHSKGGLLECGRLLSLACYRLGLAKLASPVASPGYEARSLSLAQPQDGPNGFLPTSFLA